MAYRADIEIAVRGAQDLRRLKDEVSATGKLVQQLTNYIENFGGPSVVKSINNLRDVVGKAASAFNDVALGTDEATIAAKKYIETTSALNAGLREREALLKSVTEQERKARLARAGISEVTQYAGPIGPGQASPVALRSELRGRTQQILDERKGVKELEQALLQLEERRRQETNAVLDAKAASVQLRLEREKELFLAGKTQFAEPIGPGQASPVALSSRVEGRITQILEERQGRKELNAVLQDQFEKERQLQNSKLEQKAAAVQAALDEQAAATAETASQTEKLNQRTREFTSRTDEAARAARAQTAEYLRQERILKQLRKTQATSPPGGFPVEGPMTSLGFRGMRRDIGRFGENLALGAGFPLLFGGGAGSVLGSIAGSFVGTGFGGQILGGALGQTLDQALLKIRDIGNAIDDLDFSALTESGIRFTSELQSQLDLLLQVGDAITAQKIVSQEVARETATVVGTTEDVANSVNILNDSWRKTINAVTTTVGIIAAPLAVAIAGILEVVNLIFRGINQIFSLLGKGIKTAAEFVIQLVGGKDALDFINEGIDRLNSGLSEATAKAAEFRNTLNQSVVRSAIELEAAQGLTSGVTSEEKLTNIQIEKQKQLDMLFQDEIDARVKIREENAKATAETVEGLIQQNTALFKNKRELIEATAERQAAAEIQREQARLDAEAARAAEKAARELERQRKEMERMAKLRRDQLSEAQRGFVLAELDLGVAATGTNEKARAQAEFDRRRAERMFEYTEALQKALSEEERSFLVAKQEVDIFTSKLLLNKELFDIDLQRSRLLNQQDPAAAIQEEINFLAAKIQGKEEEYKITKMIADLELEGVTDAADRVGALQGLRAQNEAIEAQKQLWADIYTTVAGQLQQAISGLIDGTAEWGDLLSNILGSLGGLFLDAAFSGLGSALKLPGFADGGFVSRPTAAVVGEGSEPEYIIPASKMPGALARYASGMRGSGVIDGAVSDNRDFLNSLTTGINGSTVDVSESQDAVAATRASLRETERLRENRMQIMSQQSASERRYERERIEQMASTPGNLNIKYESQVINSVEYVTREQAERMAAQSALRGRELAIGSLQNSVKTRKRVGIA